MKLINRLPALLVAALIALAPAAALFVAPHDAYAQATPPAADQPAAPKAAPKPPAGAGEPAKETIENPYGLEALWKQGDFVSRGTLIILIITFGSLVAAGIPLLIGITSVIAALMLIGIPSQLFPVDDNLPAVILMIGLAVGVDYSLFYLRRDREERAAGRSPDEALQVAASTSGRAVLISGLTVIVAMAGMLISGDKTFIAFAVAPGGAASLNVQPMDLALASSVDFAILSRLTKTLCGATRRLSRVERRIGTIEALSILRWTDELAPE